MKLHWLNRSRVLSMGLELVNMSLGKTVVIIGLGPIGCMMIDLARVMGATKVIGVQRSRTPNGNRKVL